MNYQLNKIQNKIFNLVNKIGGHLFHDDDWSGAHKLMDMIGQVEGVTDVRYGAGVYYNYINKERKNDPAYRDYPLLIITDFGALEGYLRCHAAGTVQDEFSAYDMTIGLYPTKLDTFEGKRMIISRPVLKEVMLREETPDNQKTQVVFDGTNASELGQNAQEKVNDALKSGVKQSAIALQGRTTNNTASDKDETVIGVDLNQGNINNSVKTAAQNFTQNGGDLNKAVFTGNVSDVTNGTNEARIYTKRQIEEGRLAEMRRTGQTFSKKEFRNNCR